MQTIKKTYNDSQITKNNLFPLIICLILTISTTTESSLVLHSKSSSNLSITLYTYRDRTTICIEDSPLLTQLDGIGMTEIGGEDTQRDGGETERGHD